MKPKLWPKLRIAPARSLPWVLLPKVMSGILLGLLTPLASWACDSNSRRMCEQQFAALVSYRSEAIDYAFGNVFATMPKQILVKFIRSDDKDYPNLDTVLYDRDRSTMVFPRRVLSYKLPNPLRWAAYYWPFYENERQHQDFPVIESIDNALWSAYLQEMAKARGLPWPHKDCESVEVGKRLPCEMLAGGIAEHVKENHQRIFNSNRVDRIWPEDFAAFQKRVWRTDLEYGEVMRYGGIMLIRPLINEFGVPRTLTYIAQTPFHVEGSSLKAAALEYQERARAALSAVPLAPVAAAAVQPVNSTIAAAQLARAPSDLAQPFFQEPSFRFRADQSQCVPVRCDSFIAPVQSPQQVGTSCMPQVITGQFLFERCK